MYQIIFAVIEHENKTICSRPKAVLVDLQLIEHDGHNPSAADLQLICSAADGSRSRIPPGGVPNTFIMCDLVFAGDVRSGCIWDGFWAESGLFFGNFARICSHNT